MTTTEEAAGIVCYTTDTPPFSAILKHRCQDSTPIDLQCLLISIQEQQWCSHLRCACFCRFTDFLVNEVDANGNVVRLTDLEVSAIPHPQPTEPSEVEKKEAEPMQHESAAAPESMPAAAEDSSAPAPQQGWAEAVAGFAGLLPADSHAAVTSFYEAIAAFEAARTHGVPKQEDGSEREYVRYRSVTMSCLATFQMLGLCKKIALTHMLEL